MLRRNTRLRKEYLYRRSLKGKEKDTYEKKRKLKEALQDGKPIPTELFKVAQDLKQDLEMEDNETLKAPNTIDDEYANVGIEDPKIMITTSRNPSPKLIQFAKEVRLIFPEAQRMNRGNHVIREIVESCRRNGVTDLILVHETRGRPDALIVSHLPYGPTAYFALVNVVTRHDIESIETMSTVAPHLIFHNFSSDLGKRVTTVLKSLFPPPKDDSKRVITFANQDDWISFRHHMYKKSGYKDVELDEIGPRFEMQLYKIKLGSVDMKEAEDEYVLRNYINSAKKRNTL
eukprot:TRINITY_DN4395_c0_g1_i1.p1 TRINITY_DN4395_c0_g1~~TRINITY_DN4395_c0_g1_i1.p1  ORF type:complete len:288 (+),score=52.98 TRINITY_DN4395_c0_g1_i1:44-907(+)